MFAPNNPVSKVKYVGMNNYILTLQAMKNNYDDNRWVTFKQAVKEEWKIKEGEKGTLCEKWLWTKEIKATNEKGEEEKQIITLERPLVRYFRVFNAEQIDGIPELDKKKDHRVKEDNIEKIADTFIKSSSCPVTEKEQAQAFYDMAKDYIVLPPRYVFKSDTAFLAVLVHEMVHSTGHQDRLKREMSGGFGGKEYAKEELIAELSSTFILGEFGVEKKLQQDQINYLDSWIKALKEEPKYLLNSFNLSVDATDFLMKGYNAELTKDLEETEIIENEMNEEEEEFENE